MEIDDIENQSFLTKANLESYSLDYFYDSLKEDETHFQEMYTSTKANLSLIHI